MPTGTRRLLQQLIGDRWLCSLIRICPFGQLQWAEPAILLLVVLGQRIFGTA